MAAQPPDQIKDADLGATIKVDVNVVTLYCSVHNKQNGLVSTLTKSDFDLAEDAKAQTIKYFSRETDIPLTMGLLIDVSGSQQNLIEPERQAGAQFFTSMMKAKDEALLISFGADSDLLQDLIKSAVAAAGAIAIEAEYGIFGSDVRPCADDEQAARHGFV